MLPINTFLVFFFFFSLSLSLYLSTRSKRRGYNDAYAAAAAAAALAAYTFEWMRGGGGKILPHSRPREEEDEEFTGWLGSSAIAQAQAV